MSDFLTRQAQRLLGAASVLQPVIASRFAQGPTLQDDTSQDWLEQVGPAARLVGPASHPLPAFVQESLPPPGEADDSTPTEAPAGNMLPPGPAPSEQPFWSEYPATQPAAEALSLGTGAPDEPVISAHQHQQPWEAASTLLAQRDTPAGSFGEDTPESTVAPAMPSVESQRPEPRRLPRQETPTAPAKPDADQPAPGQAANVSPPPEKPPADSSDTTQRALEIAGSAPPPSREPLFGKGNLAQRQPGSPGLNQQANRLESIPGLSSMPLPPVESPRQQTPPHSVSSRPGERKDETATANEQPERLEDSLASKPAQSPLGNESSPPHSAILPPGTEPAGTVSRRREKEGGLTQDGGQPGLPAQSDGEEAANQERAVPGQPVSYRDTSMSASLSAQHAAVQPGVIQRQAAPSPPAQRPQSSGQDGTPAPVEQPTTRPGSRQPQNFSPAPVGPREQSHSNDGIGVRQPTIPEQPAPSSEPMRPHPRPLSQRERGDRPEGEVGVRDRAFTPTGLRAVPPSQDLPLDTDKPIQRQVASPAAGSASPAVPPPASPAASSAMAQPSEAISSLPGESGSDESNGGSFESLGRRGVTPEGHPVSFSEQNVDLAAQPPASVSRTETIAQPRAAGSKQGETPGPTFISASDRPVLGPEHPSQRDTQRPTFIPTASTKVGESSVDRELNGPMTSRGANPFSEAQATPPDRTGGRQNMVSVSESPVRVETPPAVPQVHHKQSSPLAPPQPGSGQAQARRDEPLRQQQPQEPEQRPGMLASWPDQTRQRIPGVSNQILVPETRPIMGAGPVEGQKDTLETRQQTESSLPQVTPGREASSRLHAQPPRPKAQGLSGISETAQSPLMVNTSISPRPRLANLQRASGRPSLNKPVLSQAEGLTTSGQAGLRQIEGTPSLANGDQSEPVLGNNSALDAQWSQLPPRRSIERRPASPPTTRVNIGRIEVRTTMPPASPPAPAKSPRRSPGLSLEDYLKRRDRTQS